MLLAALYLTDGGITPGTAWHWDPNWADPDLRDDAVLHLVEALAYVQGVPSPLEAHLSASGTAAVLAASGPS
jgi:hypothetical protein